MSRLRRVLGGARITHSDAGYALDVDWLDLTAAAELDGGGASFRRKPGGGAGGGHRRARAAGPSGARRRGVARARATRGRTARARARHLVARAALAAGDLATGVEAAEQALDVDPYDEESLRLVMAALAAQGRSSSALAVYERMRAAPRR